MVKIGRKIKVEGRKRKIYKSVLKSAMKYSSETWLMRLEEASRRNDNVQKNG